MKQKQKRTDKTKKQQNPPADPPQASPTIKPTVHTPQQNSSPCLASLLRRLANSLQDSRFTHYIRNDDTDDSAEARHFRDKKQSLQKDVLQAIELAKAYSSIPKLLKTLFGLQRRIANLPEDPAFSIQEMVGGNMAAIETLYWPGLSDLPIEFREKLLDFSDAVEVEKILPALARSTTGGGKKARGQWPWIRTNQEVATYMSEQIPKYKELKPGCLAGDAQAIREFKNIFGPTAIARAIGDGCYRKAVENTPSYKFFIKRDRSIGSDVVLHRFA